METESARRTTSSPPGWSGGAGQPQASTILVAIGLMFLVAGCATGQVPFQTEGTQGQVGHPIHAGIILDEKTAGCVGHTGYRAVAFGKTRTAGLTESRRKEWGFSAQTNPARPSSKAARFAALA